MVFTCPYVYEINDSLYYHSYSSMLHRIQISLNLYVKRRKENWFDQNFSYFQLVYGMLIKQTIIWRNVILCICVCTQIYQLLENQFRMNLHYIINSVHFFKVVSNGWNIRIIAVISCIINLLKSYSINDYQTTLTLLDVSTLNSSMARNTMNTKSLSQTNIYFNNHRWLLNAQAHFNRIYQLTSILHHQFHHDT